MTASSSSAAKTPIIQLAQAPGERASWDRPSPLVYLWAIVELLLVTNPWQISSAVRIKALRLFGADIGAGVIFRPRTRVKFPWKLHIGNDSWVGEGVWFHNQDHIFIGHDVSISQDTFLTTGSHAYRSDMALTTAPIHIDAGSWITARCVVLAGSEVGRSSMALPMTVIRGRIPENSIVTGDRCEIIGTRFPL
jgi:putative colanic acid biosynthesis acetyltransferase WcaF